MKSETAENTTQKPIDVQVTVPSTAAKHVERAKPASEALPSAAKTVRAKPAVPTANKAKPVKSERAKVATKDPQVPKVGELKAPKEAKVKVSKETKVNVPKEAKVKGIKVDKVVKLKAAKEDKLKAPKDDKVTKFLVSMKKSVRKSLKKEAAEAGVSMNEFIVSAVVAKLS